MIKPIRENMRNLSNLVHAQTQRLNFRWKETKISTLLGCAKAKYYLIGPKKVTMVVYFILLQTDNSLFPPLE